VSGRPGEDWSQAWSLGFTLVGSTLFFTWLGYLLDGRLHTRPWLMVAGVFVGAVAGFANLVMGLFGDTSDKSGRSQAPGGDDDSERRSL